MTAVEVPGVGRDLLLRIRSLAPALPTAPLKVAQQILDDPAAVFSMTIDELAYQSGASQATITRFCQRLGLAGYPELKLRLAAETGRTAEPRWNVDLGSDIGPDSTPEEMASILASASIRAVQQSLELLDTAALVDAASAITSARRIHLFGAGVSGIVAQELNLRLMRLNLQTWVHSDTHAALTAATLCEPEDVFLVVSRSGRTVEALEAISEAHSRAARTISVTSFPRSPIAVHSTVVLAAHVQDSSVRHASLAARYAQLFLIDCLYTAVAQMTLETSGDALARTSEILAPRRKVR